MLKTKKKGRIGLAAALCAAVLLLCAPVFTACSGSAAGPGQDPAPETEQYEVELCFINQAYIDEGDETLERYKEEERMISGGKGELYMEALKALYQPPEGEGFATMLNEKIQINGAALDEDGRTVTVDFKSEGLSGGSTEETLLVEQIVHTLTDSFDQVEQVRFTVDGAAAETLMGHLDASVPYGIREVDDGQGEDTEMVMPLYE